MIQLFRSIFGAFAVRVLGLGISFYLNVYFASRISPADLGNYYTLTQLLLLLSVLYRAGLDMVFVKYSRVMSVQRLMGLTKFLFKKTWLYQAVGTVLLLTLVPVLQLYLEWVVILYSLLSIVPFSLAHLVAEYLKGRDVQNRSAVLQSAAIPFVTLLVFHFTAFDVLQSYFAGVVVAGSLALIWLKSVSGNHGNVEKQTADTSDEIFGSQKLFFVVALLNVVMATADTLCLSLMTSGDEVAVYGVASRIALLSSILLVAVNGVIGPRFSQYWVTGNIVGLRHEFLRATAGLALVAVLIFAVTLIVAKPFLLYFFGTAYSGSYSILVILTFGQLITLSTGPVAYGLMMTKMAAFHRRALYYAVGSNLLLNFMLIPNYGVVGAAVATAVSLSVKNAYSFVVFWNFIRSEVLKHELASQS